MASRRRAKYWLKVAGVVVTAVVGYDLYKAHTNGPRPVRTSPLP
jgi:hypothetical protein